MARYIGPVCRLCRREGVKLYLKGERCHSAKCTLEKRNHPPGMHHWRRGKLSEYGRRLREKQKTKRYYGIYERQFKNYFYRAAKETGNSGKTLLVLLERRLDNVVMRGGFALSHPHARQLVNHGHIAVNGKKIDLASYLVKEGDIITPVARENSQKLIAEIRQTVKVAPPSWLECLSDPVGLKVVNMPTTEEIPIEINPSLIVEFFSR